MNCGESLSCFEIVIALVQFKIFSQYVLTTFLLTSYNCREKLNSMNLMLYMSPIAVLVLLPAALIMEPNVLDVTLDLGRQHRFMWLLLLLNSTLAYAANLSNFLVTKHTSALTLQVCIFSLFPSYLIIEKQIGPIASCVLNQYQVSLKANISLLSIF